MAIVTFFGLLVSKCSVNRINDSHRHRGTSLIKSVWVITIHYFCFILISTWVVYFVISSFQPDRPIQVDLWTGCEHDRQALSHWQGQSANHRDFLWLFRISENTMSSMEAKETLHTLKLHPLADLRKMRPVRTVWAPISYYLFCYFCSVIWIFSCVLRQKAP